MTRKSHIQTARIVPGRLDIEVVRTDALVLNLKFRHSDAGKTPIDLSVGTHEPKMQVRRFPDQAVELEPHYSSTTPTTGQCVFNASPTEMAHLEGSYLYDIEIEALGGLPRTVLSGSFYVHPDTSKV